MTTPQMAERLNVPMRKVESWIERGYLQEPTIPANGHGSRRLWSIKDFDKAKLLPGLETILSVAAIRKILPVLSETTPSTQSNS